MILSGKLTSVSFEQPKKVSSSIFVIPSAKRTLVRSLQLAKASFPITTAPGISTSVRPVLSNAYLSIHSRLSGRSIFVSFLHAKKALSSIYFRPSGSETLSRFLQPSNMYPSISVIPWLISTLFTASFPLISFKFLISPLPSINTYPSEYSVYVALSPQEPLAITAASSPAENVSPSEKISSESDCVNSSASFSISISSELSGISSTVSSSSALSFCTSVSAALTSS